MGAFKVTDESMINEDEKGGLKEVVIGQLGQMLEQSFQETTIQQSVTVETSIDAETTSDIQSSVDLAENEIGTTEVVF